MVVVLLTILSRKYANLLLKAARHCRTTASLPACPLAMSEHWPSIVDRTCPPPPPITRAGMTTTTTPQQQQRVLLLQRVVVAAAALSTQYLGQHEVGVDLQVAVHQHHA